MNLNSRNEIASTTRSDILDHIVVSIQDGILLIILQNLSNIIGEEGIINFGNVLHYCVREIRI